MRTRAYMQTFLWLMLAVLVGQSASAPLPDVRFLPGSYAGEMESTFKLEPEVRVHLNVPGNAASNTIPLLVYYALPNGNSIEQTAGAKAREDLDWHYNIQHIAAQTRFLRQALPERAISIAYLEAAQKSWPAWRKKHGDAPIPGLLSQIARTASCESAEIVLNGHSGGGSLIFGYIDAVEQIPEKVVRIGFLDSNYAYNKDRGHLEKLSAWIAATNHYLCVLAYDDASALLNGKPFVSASGGTWGRSHALWKDLAAKFTFTKKSKEDLITVTALGGRIQFLLKPNPEKRIYHTVQVERNGFIHSMLSGTAKENAGYQYFGNRAYEQFIVD